MRLGLFTERICRSGTTLLTESRAASGRAAADYPGALMSVKQIFIPANHEYLNDRDLDLSTAPLASS
jgi:hypothetical protein